MASHAGVSAVTVSRALRQPDMVSLDLRERIDVSVRELGYIPNQLASALASARTGTIGVVVPSLTNIVFADYLKALHDIFQPAGFQVLVLNSRYALVDEERAISTLLGQHPEAMIVAGIDQTDHARKLLENAGIPVVQTMELADDPIDINIGLSQVDAGYAATRYLLDLGFRRIGHVAARLEPRARRRMEGYRRAMEEFGQDTNLLVASTRRPSTFALGAEMFAEGLASTPDMEAVFCCNDDLALGALFECQRRGIRVPEDLSIIGFNDLEFCASSYPALTSVSTPRYEIARRAAEIVLDVVRGSGNRPEERRIDLGFTIVERESTRPKRPGGT
ncbi:LacI family DNA-binding transcriptional regulator [Microbaculum marinum]|uniref:LacI family DNA-binding transcriptional regulator n=1 Tax=Microbaculum marinum TaxID=1764581 RepID=A0AAW9RFA7_9HYPH